MRQSAHERKISVLLLVASLLFLTSCNPAVKFALGGLGVTASVLADVTVPIVGVSFTYHQIILFAGMEFFERIANSQFVPDPDFKVLASKADPIYLDIPLANGGMNSNQGGRDESKAREGH